MTRLLHISDLHHGPPFAREIGDAVLRLAPALEPDAIVVSGDITQRARREQFQQARVFLDALPTVPRLVVPGNHDVPLYRVFERLTDPLGLYREYINEDTNPVLHLDGVVIVGLDSTSPRRALVNGRVHRDQLEYCRSVFEHAPADAARIVVAHHHFAPAPDYRRDQTMPRAKRAIECFVDLGVEMIMGGHLHRAFIGNSLDFFPRSSSDRGIIIVQCGTTTSRRGIGRERNKNTLNVIDIESEAIRIEHYLFDEAHGDFAPMSYHVFRRRAAGPATTVSAVAG